MLIKALHTVNRIVLPPKRQGETLNVEFDFLSQLAVGETISTKSTICSVFTGVDASPSSMINGAATNSGTIVTQSITGGTVGVVYILVCTITTSASQTIKIAAYLYVEPDLS